MLQINPVNSDNYCYAPRKHQPGLRQFTAQEVADQIDVKDNRYNGCHFLGEAVFAIFPELLTRSDQYITTFVDEVSLVLNETRRAGNGTTCYANGDNPDTLSLLSC